MLGMVHADECHVVDLVDDVLQAADRGLELAWQVGELRACRRSGGRSPRPRGGVDHLVRAIHRPVGSPAPRAGSRRTPRWSAARRCPGRRQISGMSSTGSSGTGRSPGRSDVAVSRANSVESRRAPAVTAAVSSAAVAAYPHHEVRRLEQVGVVVAREGAVVALFALGVEASQREPAAQVVLVMLSKPCLESRRSMRVRTLRASSSVLEHPWGSAVGRPGPLFPRLRVFTGLVIGWLSK